MKRTSNEFKKLQAKWYKKIKDRGFDDIEQDDDNLKVWSYKLFTVQRNLTLFEAKEEYYRLAGQFLHDHTFTDDFERAVWELHAAGESNQKAAEALELRGVHATRNAVQLLTQGLAKIMLKKYNVSR